MNHMTKIDEDGVPRLVQEIEFLTERRLMKVTTFDGVQWLLPLRGITDLEFAYTVAEEVAAQTLYPQPKT